MSDETTKHTKTPWRINRNAPVVAIGAPSRSEYKSSAAIEADDCPSRYGVIPQGILHLEDAKFIVKAVNAHDSLATALRELVEAEDALVAKQQNPGSSHFQWANEVVDLSDRLDKAFNRARAKLKEIE